LRRPIRSIRQQLIRRGERTLRGRSYDDDLFKERKNLTKRVPTKQLFPNKNSRMSSLEERDCYRKRTKAADQF